MRALQLDGAMAMVYGRVDLARWRALDAAGEHLHCFLDGVDVTWRCLLADDVADEVELYALDADGRYYRDPKHPGEAARETRRGAVTIRAVVHDGTCRTQAKEHAHDPRRRDRR